MSTKLSTTQREHTLDASVSNYVAKGYLVEWRTPTKVSLHKKASKTEIWLWVSMVGAPVAYFMMAGRRVGLDVDQVGNVRFQKAKKRK